MAAGVDDLSGISLEGVVVVFGSASLATLAFLATNSNSVLANGDLGLQQVSRQIERHVPDTCSCIHKIAFLSVLVQK